MKDDKDQIDECKALSKLKKDVSSHVPVTIMLQERLPDADRQARYSALRSSFKKLMSTDFIDTTKISIDYDSISISSQTIQADLPIESFVDIKVMLESTGARVDIIRNIQILDDK